MKMMSQRPKFYVYIGNDGRTYKTDEKTTAEINAAISRGADVQGGKVLRPQWDKPKDPSMIVGAWQVGKHGRTEVRCFWALRSHSKGCSGCKMVDDTTCAIKVPYAMKYDPKTGFWTILEPECKADDKLSRKLDTNQL